MAPLEGEVLDKFSGPEADDDAYTVMQVRFEGLTPEEVPFNAKDIVVVSVREEA